MLLASKCILRYFKHIIFNVHHRWAHTHNCCTSCLPIAAYLYLCRNLFRKANAWNASYAARNEKWTILNNKIIYYSIFKSWKKESKCQYEKKIFPGFRQKYIFYYHNNIRQSLRSEANATNNKKTTTKN